MRKLRDAIIRTISPEQSNDVKAALQNSKARRRRVQGTCGEVLTSDEVQERLKQEEILRNSKKSKKKL